jgi:putative addiction module CopG family antidote
MNIRAWPLQRPGAGGRLIANRETRTVPLSAEDATYVDTLVASGAYASAGEVVRAGLQALQERQTANDRWLQEEVVPVYDAILLPLLGKRQCRPVLGAEHSETPIGSAAMRIIRW